MKRKIKKVDHPKGEEDFDHKRIVLLQSATKQQALFHEKILSEWTRYKRFTVKHRDMKLEPQFTSASVYSEANMIAKDHRVSVFFPCNRSENVLQRSLRTCDSYRAVLSPRGDPSYEASCNRRVGKQAEYLDPLFWWIKSWVALRQIRVARWNFEYFRNPSRCCERFGDTDIAYKEAFVNYDWPGVVSLPGEKDLKEERNRKVQNTALKQRVESLN